MGAFFTNYQVRSKSSADVERVLTPLVARRAYVSPVKHEWVTVYDEASDDQDESEMRRLGQAISRQLSTTVVAFLVHDSDVLMYFLFESGRITDEYNSCPDYFGEVDERTRARTVGKALALLPYCRPGASHEMLEQVIHPETQFAMADSILEELAPLLGMDAQRTRIGFKYFEEEAHELLDDAEKFRLVGRNVTDADRQAVREELRDRRAEAGATSADTPTIDPFSYSMAAGMIATSRGSTFPSISGIGAHPGVNEDALAKQLRKQFDQMGRKALRGATPANQPSADELAAAADKGPAEFAKLLVARAPECLGDVAVTIAGQCRSEWMRALVEVGADVNFTNKHGVTPLKAATGNSEMLNYLLSAGAMH